MDMHKYDNCLDSTGSGGNALQLKLTNLHPSITTLAANHKAQGSH